MDRERDKDSDRVRDRRERRLVILIMLPIGHGYTVSHITFLHLSHTQTGVPGVSETRICQQSLLICLLEGRLNLLLRRWVAPPGPFGAFGVCLRYGIAVLYVCARVVGVMYKCDGEH